MSQNVSYRELAAPVVAVAFTAIVLLGMLQRLPLSVDFTDEAFSTALPYRFALGDRPFIDEINSAQTAGLIVTPFVWLYIKLTRGTAGIMLFTRLLFVVFKLGLAAVVFRTIKRHVSWPLALAASLVCIVFVPGSSPNLGYNVLGSGFLAMGAFVAARGEPGAPDRRALFWSGICNGLATLAYPPLVVPAAVLGFVVLARADEKRRRRDFGEYVAGGAVVVLCVAPFLVLAGAKNLQAMLEFGSRLAPRPPSKLFDIILAFWAHSPVSFWIVPAVAMVIAALKVRPAWSLWVLPLFVSAVALAFPGGVLSQFSVIIYAALFAPVFLVLLWDQTFCRTLFYVVWVPSLLAGVITAFTSGNGEINGAIGFFPAAILFVVYQAIAVEKLSREAHPDSRVFASYAPLMQLGPAVLVLSMLARYSFSVYRDGAIQDLKVRIESGPFRGLYTTQERANQSAEIEDILRRHDQPNGKVLIYWEFPAGYLFTGMRPAGNTVWMVPMADQNALLSYYRGRINGAGLVLKLRGSGPSGTPVDQFLETNGRELDSSPKYQIIAEPRP